MKIPVKKYEPNQLAIADVNTVLKEGYGPNDPIRRIAEEYRKLEAHHKEETEWMVKEIQRLEAVCDSQEREIDRLEREDYGDDI